MAPDIHPSSDVVSRARVRTILAKMLFAPMEHLCLDDGRSEGEVFNKRVRAAAHSLGVDIDK